VLRAREPHTARPFKVPFYPILPIIFCAACAYMLQSSLGYVGGNTFLGVNAAWVGVGVLGIGVVLMVMLGGLKRDQTAAAKR
jgi:amino acid transporter